MTVRLERPSPTDAAASSVPDTLPDIAQKLRRLSVELAATHFAVCLVTGSGAPPRLLPVLDTEYPRMAERTRVLPELPQPLIRHAASHTAPFRWTTSDAGPGKTERAALRLFGAELDFSGLGFPVFTEAGQRGVVFFTGDDMDLAGDLLWDAHCRCLRLFGMIVRLRPTTPARPPHMSRREIECLKLTASGLTSEDISRRLGLSVHTANQYLASTTRKLDATNRIHAVAKAMRLGLLD